MMNNSTPKATAKFKMSLGEKQKHSEGFNRVGSAGEQMEKMNKAESKMGMDSASNLDSGKKVKTSPLAKKALVVSIGEADVKEVKGKSPLKKYEGFGKLEGSLEKKGYSKESAGAIAASIGRKKYGAKKFNKAAAKGKSLRNAKPKKK